MMPLIIAVISVGVGERQGLSQDLGGQQYTQISTIYMYKFIKIRHDILIQSHGNYMEMTKINCMLQIDSLRNFSQIFLGVLRGAF